MPELSDNLPLRVLWFTRDLTGQVYGPLTTAQLQRLCDERKCESLEVQRLGSGQWKFAGRVPVLHLPAPMNDPPLTPEEERAALDLWGQQLARQAGRGGAVFFGILLAILLMMAGNFTAEELGASNFLIIVGSSCLCLVLSWIGGLVALGWLPSNARRLFRLSPAWCAMGLIGAGGLILLFAAITLGVGGLLLRLF